MTGKKLSLSPFGLAVLFLLLLAGTLIVRFLDADHAIVAALKVVCAAIAVGIVPGAILTLVSRPRPELSFFEFAGFAAALSFGVVQLMTVFAVTAHVSATFVLVGLGVAAAAGIWRCLFRPPPIVIRIGVDDAILLTLLAILAAFLYLQGSPVEAFEDQVHAAIVRRLAHLEHPALDNLYVAPGIVYTYPFPGTHYFMALIARLGEVDALFVYHKLRFYWGPVALVMVYLAARAVFGTAAVASATAVTAAVFAATGIFGMVDGFAWGWGQLAPYSHAADVAMNVLLPALLAVSFGYIHAQSPRERTFLLCTTAMLVFMLTVVHIREMVQFAVYVGCFLAAAAGVRAFRSQWRRALVLLPLTVGTAALYAAWEGRTAAIVATLVEQQRAKLADIAAGASFAELLTTPASSMLSDFIVNADDVFTGLMPFFLFVGPIAVFLFRRRPLVWLMAASIVVYVLVMQVPLLAVAYIYATYYEILYTPVRNIVFFVYLLTGAALYSIVLAVARIDRTRLTLVVSGAVVGVVALLATIYGNRSGSGFFAPLAIAYALTFLFLPRSELVRRPSTLTAAMAGLIAVVALVALIPEARPPEPSAGVNVRWTERLPDAERASLERQFSLAGGTPTGRPSDEVNVWSYRLNDLSVENVRGLVRHPRVVDTQNIDRSNFVAAPDPPRVAHPFFGVVHVSWLQYPPAALIVFAGLITGALGLLVPAALARQRDGRWTAALESAWQEPFYRRALPYALFLIPFAVLSFRPGLSPFTLSPLSPFGRADTPRAMIAQAPCLDTSRMPLPTPANAGPEGLIVDARPGCPPSYEVMQWIQDRVPVDAVFASNRWNPYLPTMFVPQQVVMFPPVERSSEPERDLFKAYYGLFDARVRKYRRQPFFNSEETAAERVEFLETLRVTHVLVDPAYYDDMQQALEPLSAVLEPKYADGRWAVYEVKRGSGGGLRPEPGLP